MPAIVYGPAISTYVRTARLALEEKGVAYTLENVDIMAGDHKKPAHLARHPFGRVPAFEHDGFALYETSAITRYVDRAFPGPALQPSEPRALARMDQMIAIVDSYVYPCLVTTLVIERLIAPMQGRAPDAAAIDAALPMAEIAISELERLAAGREFLVGESLSLADLHLAPIFFYFTQTPDAAKLLEPHPKLRAWWAAVAQRKSMAATPPKF